MTKRFRIGVTALACAFLLHACAKSSDSVTGSYVSPLQYGSYDCDQLAAEAGRLSARVAEVSGNQDDAAARDAVATTVGVVLFWPALFFLAAGDNEAELARLKGEFDAVERAAIEKKCSLADDIRRGREEAAAARAKKKAEAEAANKAKAPGD